ncbi:MAG: transposase [Bacteroidetes bacterium]|nr:transposase [Bacteroidota bacterium]
MANLRHKTGLYFFTATNLNWLPVLESSNHKNIIIQSLCFMVEHQRIEVFGFVIMPNHIHLILRIIEPHKKSDIQRDFLKFTAQRIHFNLIKTNDPILDLLVVRSKDRMVQVWERHAFWFELDTTNTLLQKLRYIHNNPLQEKWRLAEQEEDYYYSSAAFYKGGDNEFPFLKHYESLFD